MQCSEVFFTIRQNQTLSTPIEILSHFPSKKKNLFFYQIVKALNFSVTATVNLWLVFKKRITD